MGDLEIPPMAELSTKPYLIRAIYEWCADCGFTPYIGVNVDQNTRVPMEYVKKGQIVLSIGMQATRDLTIGNDLIQFSARFSGVSREIAVPIYAVASIFARENGQGMHFEREPAPLTSVPASTNVPESGPTLVLQPSLQVQPQLQSVQSGVVAEVAPATARVADHSAQDLGATGKQLTDHKPTDDKTTNDKPTDDTTANESPLGDKPKGSPRGKLRIIK